MSPGWTIVSDGVGACSYELYWVSLIVKATELMKLLIKYQPEDKKAKHQRLKEMAAAKEAGKELPRSKPPKVIKFGLKHVTTLVEEQKASLVVIAHDVNPIELVVWLPALCRKMGVPYCIIKSKVRCVVTWSTCD